MKWGIIITVILWQASIARAEESETDEKSEGAALAMSTVPVVAAVVISIASADSAFDDDPSTGMKVLAGGALVGVTLGPSFGHWYSGEIVSTGLLIRGGAIATGIGAGFALESGRDDLGVALGTVTMLGFATGVVWDIATARRAAREYNASVQTTIVPLTGDTTGVEVAGAF